MSSVEDRTVGLGSDEVQQTVRAGVEAEASAVSSGLFVLKGVEYRKVRCLNSSSGEAQVFLVEHGRNENGKLFVLKVYYPNFDTNKKLLKRIHSFNFEMIVRLYDYGKTYVDGKHRDYELMEYLCGGTLSEYKLKGDLNQFRRIQICYIQR